MSDTAAFWQGFLRDTGRPADTECAYCDHFELSEKLANELLALVLRGQKRATASSLYAFERRGEPLPKVGDLGIFTDWAGEPKCVAETTKVTVLPFRDMTFDIVRREGEDDDLESWRRGHRRFFTDEGAELGYAFSEDMPVVFEDFRVVCRPDAKRVIVLAGSPRPHGNSAALAAAFAEGAREAGHRAEVISVAGKRVGGCLGCNRCCADPDHACALKDDMPEMYRRLAEADVIAAATPIYFYGVSAQLKCLIDRLHNPIRNSFRVKKLCLLMACADEIDTVFDSVLAMYRSVLCYFSLEDGGVVAVRGVRDAGDIEGHPLLERARALGRGL